jgi:PAS domain S-box-containing protein
VVSSPSRRDARNETGEEATLLDRLFDILAAPGLPPHGFCLLWQPELVWLHAGSDAVIAAAYFSIPLALAHFVSRRRDIRFGWIIWLFAAFILACGTTHLFGIWNLWRADYGAEGLIKAVTAVVSATTAVVLWPLVRQALAVPTPAQFQAVSESLAAERGERASAQRALRTSEQSLRLLVDGLTEHALFMLDAEGRVASWNTGAVRIKGYAEEEVGGRHFSLFYTEDDRAAGLPARALEAAAREGRYEAEGWRLRKDGTRFWASVVIQPLRDESGRILLGYAKLTRDLTERRCAEDALEQTRAALVQAQKMETVGQLTGGIAHDFNNLLTAILGGATLLERRAGERLDADGRRLLSSIRQAAGRAAELTHRLLAFSRRQTLAPRPTDLNRLVAGMSELLRRTLGEAVAVETVLAGGLWPCLVDANQLENAVLNLAVNARDAMPDGGRLTIETANAYLDEAYAATHAEVAPGQYVMVAVSDSGTGMAPEVLARVFEPFFTTKPEGRGTGLGLAQVYGFVKQSGGHIKAYSELGQGTTVKVYLPRHAGEGGAEERREGPSYAELPRGRGEAVLVVEDHEEVRDYAVNALAHLGYRVLEAPDARAALDLLAREPGVALLFTDVGLPSGMNGRKLAEEATRRAPGLLVLFTTAYARNAISHHGVLDRDVHLLPKPYTIDVLARKLRDVLDAGTPKA